mgnify:FL=1
MEQLNEQTNFVLPSGEVHWPNFGYLYWLHYYYGPRSIYLQKVSIRWFVIELYYRIAKRRRTVFAFRQTNTQLRLVLVTTQISTTGSAGIGYRYDPSHVASHTHNHAPSPPFQDARLHRIVQRLSSSNCCACCCETSHIYEHAETTHLRIIGAV